MPQEYSQEEVGKSSWNPVNLDSSPQEISARFNELKEASIQGDLPSVLRLAPGLSKVVDEDGKTALYHSARAGNAQIVRALLQAGSEPSVAEFSMGATPLYIATLYDRIDVVKLLLEAGADSSPALRNAGPYVVKGATPLAIATQHGRMEMVKVLLKHGALINKVDAHGLSPLHVAMLTGQNLVAYLLVEHGADVNLVAFIEKNPVNPLALAAATKDSKLTMLMLKHGGLLNSIPLGYRYINKAKNFIRRLKQMERKLEQGSHESGQSHNADLVRPHAAADTQYDGDFQIGSGLQLETPNQIKANYKHYQDGSTQKMGPHASKPELLQMSDILQPSVKHIYSPRLISDPIQDTNSLTDSGSSSKAINLWASMPLAVFALFFALLIPIVVIAVTGLINRHRKDKCLKVAVAAGATIQRYRSQSTTPSYNRMPSPFSPAHAISDQSRRSAERQYLEGDRRSGERQYLEGDTSSSQALVLHSGQSSVRRSTRRRHAVPKKHTKEEKARVTISPRTEQSHEEEASTSAMGFETRSPSRPGIETSHQQDLIHDAHLVAGSVNAILGGGHYELHLEDLDTPQNMDVPTPMEQDLADIQAECIKLVPEIIQAHESSCSSRAMDKSDSHCKDNCPVCFEAPRNTFLMPCGHVICRCCSDQLELCPICRVDIKGRFRVYL